MAKHPSRATLRTIRQRLGLSARDLSQLVGVSESYVCRIERGEIRGSKTFRARACAAVGARLEWLLFDEEGSTDAR